MSCRNNVDNSTVSSKTISFKVSKEDSSKAWTRIEVPKETLSGNKAANSLSALSNEDAAFKSDTNRAINRGCN